MMESVEARSLFAEEQHWTVAKLTEALKRTLRSQFGNVHVLGEISGLKLAASGHYYFTLKDATATLRCAMFRNQARLLRMQPKDGMLVLVRGGIDIYEPRGEYQMIVEWLQPQGQGELQLAFEQLKEKLEKEGLFAKERKRALPVFPRRIGIVTSPTGAVIRDMLNVLRRRFAGLHIRLYPAQVQGAGSAEQVCEGLRWFSENEWADVVIVGRGGGSLEDLWTFNEESVARAIANCTVPVISAVGHETDFTIADFVADLRAPTPSAAAELVIAPKAQWIDRVEGGQERATRAMVFALTRASERVNRQGAQRAQLVLQRSIGRAMQRTDEAEATVRNAMRLRIQQQRRKLEELEKRLARADVKVKLRDWRARLDKAWQAAEPGMRKRLLLQHAKLENLAQQARQMSPLAVLERGYSIALLADGRALRKAEEAPTGTQIDVRLHQGRVKARVED
jgi:exodeoxyribonuclease VII large subunit